MKTTTRIYTNGKSLFTLEDYAQGGVCHVHGIKFYEEMDVLKVRALHENGNLHYVFGVGDRKVLKDIHLKRKGGGGKIGNFKIY